MLGMTGSVSVFYMSLGAMSLGAVCFVHFLYALWGYFLVEVEYVCAFLILCTFFIVSSDASLDFCRGKETFCGDSLCVNSKICVCVHILQSTSLCCEFYSLISRLIWYLWCDFVQYEYLVIPGHVLICITSMYYRAYLCIMSFVKCASMAKVTANKAILCCQSTCCSEILLITGHLLCVVWCIWQLGFNLHDIRNVWVRWNSSMYGIYMCIMRYLMYVGQYAGVHDAFYCTDKTVFHENSIFEY